MRIWRLKNAKKYRAYKKIWNRNWRAENKDKLQVSALAQKAKWPEKFKARNAVNNAIRDGRLKKKPCEVCGKKAQAHHENYNNPLKVRWFCPIHHTRIHILNLT